MVKDIREQRPNYGCNLCKSYYYQWATPQEVTNNMLEKLWCNKCAIYKMYLELDYYDRLMFDDGK